MLDLKFLISSLIACLNYFVFRFLKDVLLLNFSYVCHVLLCSGEFERNVDTSKSCFYSIHYSFDLINYCIIPYKNNSGIKQIFIYFSFNCFISRLKIKKKFFRWSLIFSINHFASLSFNKIISLSCTSNYFFYRISFLHSWV